MNTRPLQTELDDYRKKTPDLLVACAHVLWVIPLFGFISGFVSCVNADSAQHINSSILGANDPLLYPFKKMWLGVKIGIPAFCVLLGTVWAVRTRGQARLEAAVREHQREINARARDEEACANARARDAEARAKEQYEMLGSRAGLAACNFCGRQVSMSASTCPQCGSSPFAGCCQLCAKPMGPNRDDYAYRPRAHLSCLERQLAPPACTFCGAQLPLGYMRRMISGDECPTCGDPRQVKDLSCAICGRVVYMSDEFVTEFVASKSTNVLMHAACKRALDDDAHARCRAN